MEQKKRCRWIDMAKGIGIILVIYGHISFCPEWFKIWLCSFHMPLFFFLAGITLNVGKYERMSQLVKVKFEQLIIPYFIFVCMQWGWKVIEEIIKMLRGGQHRWMCVSKTVHWNFCTSQNN